MKTVTIRKGTGLDRFLNRFARKVARTKTKFVVNQGIRTYEDNLCPIEFVGDFGFLSAGIYMGKQLGLTARNVWEIMEAADVADNLSPREQKIRERMLAAVQKHTVTS